MHEGFLQWVLVFMVTHSLGSNPPSPALPCLPTNEQIGYNIFLSFLGNKKTDDDVKSALVPTDAGNIERFAEDAKED